MSYLRLSIILVLLIVGNSFAQEATPEATVEASPEIELAAFTLPELDISGAAPADWDELQIGSYVNTDDADNVTYLLHFAVNDMSLDELLQPILEAFTQEALPETSESYESDVYTWSLYNFEYSPIPDSDSSLFVDIAIVEQGALVLVVILQSKPEEYDLLHEMVFLTAVDYFGQELEIIAADLGFGDMIATTIDDFGINTVTPKDWKNANLGSYIRGNLQLDPTTLLIQTSSDLSETEFRDLFLERLQISITSEGEAYSSDTLEWTIFVVNVDLEGTLLTWQIATASDTNYAYLVVLFSFTEEADSLRESILLPVLDATRPSE